MRQPKSKAFSILSLFLGIFLLFSLSLSLPAAELKTVIDALGARKSTLTIFKEYAVTVDTTVPANITLEFLQGGTLNISNTKTVTMNGHVEAGLFQIFEWTGTGKVTFGPSSVREVYPQWWGAIGNDVADNRVALQAAATAAAGSTLFFPEGIYLISDFITIPANTTVMGGGIGSVIKANAVAFTTYEAVHSGVFIVIGDNVSFQNLYVQGAWTTGAGNNTHGIYYAVGVQGGEVSGCWVTNHSYSGIFTKLNVRVINNYVDTCAIDGIELVGNNNVAIGNIVKSCGLSTTPGVAGIELAAAKNQCVIQGNIIQDCLGGILLNDEVNDVIVNANVINNFSGRGINVVGSTSGSNRIITGNTLTLGTTAGSLGRGISITGCDGFIVNNNIIKDLAADGIVIEGVAVNGDVSHNKITTCNFGLIYVGTGDTITFIANHAWGNVTQDYSITGTMTGVVLKHNIGLADTLEVLGVPTSLTIAGGVITVSRMYNILTPQGGAVDDLDTINGGVDGALLILSGDGTFQIDIKHNVGNILLSGAADYLLPTTTERILLQYDATLTKWIGFPGY